MLKSEPQKKNYSQESIKNIFVLSYCKIYSLFALNLFISLWSKEQGNIYLSCTACQEKVCKAKFAFSTLQVSFYPVHYLPLFPELTRSISLALNTIAINCQYLMILSLQWCYRSSLLIFDTLSIKGVRKISNNLVFILIWFPCIPPIHSLSVLNLPQLSKNFYSEWEILSLVTTSTIWPSCKEVSVWAQGGDKCLTELVSTDHHWVQCHSSLRQCFTIFPVKKFIPILICNLLCCDSGWSFLFLFTIES